jgi:hypothetical protein
MHTRDNSFANIAALSLLALLWSGCGKKEVPAAIVAPPPLANLAPPVIEQPKEKPVYVYSGDRFRDPFVPAGTTANYQPDAVFDPQRAAVKGIIFGRGYKSAVLTVGGTGSYFIKSGKIIDIMGKAVDGFSAKVFVDKVLVLGEADNVYELKIREDEEEEKPL